MQLHELLASLPHGDELTALIDDGVPVPDNDPEFIDEFGGEHSGATEDVRDMDARGAVIA